MNVKSDSLICSTALWSGEGTSACAAPAEKRRYQAAVVTTQRTCATARKSSVQL
jgi:hypothetical protein